MGWHTVRNLWKFSLNEIAPRLAAVAKAQRRGGLLGRRASVAVWMALVTPVMAGTAGLGIEVSNWSVAKGDVQRMADMAAIGAMVTYNQTGDIQKAALAAARLAEINGANGSTDPTWDSSTQTLSDNQVTVQVVPGIRNSADTAVKVTVQETIPVYLAHVLLPQKSVTVSSDGYAELISRGGAGPAVCLLGLGGGMDGTTSGNDLTFSGAVSIDSSACALRSNDGISFTGAVSAETDGVYAGGTISQTGAVSISGSLVSNAGQISDPYAGLNDLQSALDSAATAIGSDVKVSGSNNITLSPGNYSSITVSGAANVTFQPGLYLVNGNVSFSGATSISGRGVSIVASGTFSTSGSSYVHLTAATSDDDDDGAIPGIVFASRSSATSSFKGSTSFPVTGAIYYPNGELDFAGSVDGGTCSQIVAGSFKANGAVSLSPNCSMYSLPSIESQTPTYIAMLVE